jgi:O-antigen ligase
VQIWPILFDFWKDHPLTGSGYGAFWDIRDPQPIYEYMSGYPAWQAWIADLTSAHNGYIDLLVQTGLPGLVLGVCATLLAPLWKVLTSLTLTRPAAACCWRPSCSPCVTTSPSRASSTATLP